MQQLTLFFSWQSDIKPNHAIIQKALIEACAQITNEGECELTYTESTWGVSGSPVIEDSVKEKILNCDLFVADVSPVVKTEKKDYPNPNVMLELGLAKSVLTDDKTLLLYCGQIDPNRLPFDINHQRMTMFDGAQMETYVLSMVETALKNPKYKSQFDKDDRNLHNNGNVLKNIVSGKYLPDVYLEDREQKQYLRDFVAPMEFGKLVLERCDAIDTYKMNRDRCFRHREKFEYDINPYKNLVDTSDFSLFYERALALRDYLHGRYEDSSTERSDYRMRTDKFGAQFLHLQYVTSRLLLITSAAGQGKTNLVCDLVDKVLLRRDIPFVYLNGYEIDAENIEGSFVKKLCPIGNHSLDELLPDVATYCQRKRNPIIIIIDGLNENANPLKFSQNLESFLSEILRHYYIKVILTCRTEYYNECFSTLDALFGNKMCRMDAINRFHGRDDQEKLLNNYLHYFQIKVHLGKLVADTLCKDLLLLRIFCEAHRGKSVGNMHSINKDVLFAQYYEMMAKKLIEKVRNENGYKLSPKKIQSFVEILLEYMIQENRFFNVPIELVEEKLSSIEYEIFQRFIDENILLRRDLNLDGKGLYAHSEVINFTYDAFRDYLLSTYLSDNVAVHDEKRYQELVYRYTQEGHQLRESLRPFLFVHAKNQARLTMVRYLSTMEWYESVYPLYIWDVEDRFITDDDLEEVKRLLEKEHDDFVAQRLLFWDRWNEEQYPRLNIRILLDYLSTLDDEQLPVFLEKAWSEKNVVQWNGRPRVSERVQLSRSIEELLSNMDFMSHKCSHNIFELLLYMVPHSGGYVADVFEKFYMQYKPADMIKRVENSTKSEKLKGYINTRKL